MISSLHSINTHNFIKKFIFICLFLVLTNNCYASNQTNLSEKKKLYGTWSGLNSKGEKTIVTFEKDNEFYLLEGEKSLFNALPEGFIMKYNAIFEVVPHQLYFDIFENGKKINSIAWGIFKIEKGKLIIREAIEYVKKYGGITTGRRFKFPANFNGSLVILEQSRSMSKKNIWELKKDMNEDGVFTISDVGKTLQVIFFYPGNLCLYIITESKIGNFFELSTNDYCGTFTFIMSFIFWFLIMIGIT